MFIGEYRHSIDQKGRLAVPTKFRKALELGAIVTRGLDGCLYLYPADSWKQVAEKLAKLPMSQSNSRAFARLMLAGAMDVALDAQGRILVPDYLRAYAAIGKDAVVAGLYDRLEIWDKATWEAYKKRTEKDGGQIAETLGSLGI
jgi:MraZ protein